MDVAAAGPLVLDTLTRACSQSAEVLKPAEQQLKQWETQPGFYSILLSIFSDHAIDVNVRWLAVLYFKNGVDRYWRKTAPNAICEEERASLRQRLIANFNEPVNQIATQLAVLIAKIARIDCPRSWHDLIPTLLQAVKYEDELLQQRALLTLHHVTKTLASKRLPNDRKVFEELTSNIFSYMLQLWNNHTENFLRHLMVEPVDVKKIVVSMDHGLLTLKVLRKLLVYGIKDPAKSEDGVTSLKLVFDRIKTLLQCKKQMSCAHDLLQRREKHVTLLTKVLLDHQSMHPEAFVQFIRPSLELAVQYNFTAAGTDICFERFTVNTFNLVRSILRCETYRPAKTIEDTKNPLTLEAYKIKVSFFTTEVLSEIVNQLLSRYFLLSLDDLHNWDADPEDFVCDEGGDSWKFSLRPCTENLYLTLIKEFREIITPVVLQMVKQYQGPVDPDDLSAILRKDAVYNAAGQASFDLYDEVDFDQWFSTYLLAELQNKHTKIIRRRVIWLIGCWTCVKLSVNLRPQLYEAILPMLQQSEDLVVRIEAANTLKIAVDDFEFNVEQFLPYLEGSFSLLFQLLKDVTECETKMQVLHVMSFVIERVGIQVRPYAAGLIQYLPLLWQESADHNMLRCAILTTLVCLVQGLGSLCVNMYDLLLPVIALSTDVSEDPHVYLMEDGLELWQATLHCSPTITPGLIQLWKNMPALFDKGSETLRTCLKITEAYLLLGPNDFLQMYSTMLVSCLSTLLTELRSEGQVMVYKVQEIVFKLFPLEAPSVFRQFLPKCFFGILDSKECPMVLSMFMSLFARIILQNQPFLWSFLAQMAKEHGKESMELLGALLDAWTDSTDNNTQLERKKLTALALSSLLTANNSVVLERFGQIINVCVETLHDVCRAEASDIQVDCLVMGDQNTETSEEESEHDRRKKQLSLQDPVHSVSLKDFVMSQLTQCQQQHGQAGFEHLMDSVHPDISQQLQMFMK